MWPFLRSRPWRKRQDSVPVSMMCALWVIRSTTALARRGSGNTLVHSPNGRFVVTISDPRSKNLPVPRGTTAREKLKAYLAAELGEIDP